MALDKESGFGFHLLLSAGGEAGDEEQREVGLLFYWTGSVRCQTAAVSLC